VALANFDLRGLWRELRLSDGAANFRKVAAKLIQGFPEVVEPLLGRSGRRRWLRHSGHSKEGFNWLNRDTDVVFRPDETPPRRPEPEAVPALPMTVVPLTANDHRIHITVSSQFLDQLETARRGHGHVQPRATKEQVLEAALDLLLERQACRRAEVRRPQKNRVRRSPTTSPLR